MVECKTENVTNPEGVTVVERVARAIAGDAVASGAVAGAAAESTDVGLNREDGERGGEGGGKGETHGEFWTGVRGLVVVLLPLELRPLNTREAKRGTNETNIAKGLALRPRPWQSAQQHAFDQQRNDPECAWGGTASCSPRSSAEGSSLCVC